MVNPGIRREGASAGMAGDEAVGQVALLPGVMNFILPSQFVTSGDARKRSWREDRGGQNWNGIWGRGRDLEFGRYDGKDSQVGMRFWGVQ